MQATLLLAFYDCYLSVVNIVNSNCVLKIVPKVATSPGLSPRVSHNIFNGLGKHVPVGIRLDRLDMAELIFF